MDLANPSPKKRGGVCKTPHVVVLRRCPPPPPPPTLGTILKNSASKTSIFEPPRVKKCRRRLCTNLLGTPLPPRSPRTQSPNKVKNV